MRPEPKELPVQLLAEHRRWFSWLALTLFFAAPGVLWALASPLFSVPDEPAHVIKAVALWHGQVTGEDHISSNGHVTTVFRLPGIWAKANGYPTCFAFHPDVTADCALSFAGPSTTMDAESTAGHYPPLFYAMVGWAGRLFAGPVGVYLMRVTSSVVCGALMAAGARALLRVIDPRLALTSIFAAAVPMAYFLAGSVNPSGIEIASAIAVWATALAVLHADDAEAPGGLLLQLVIVAAVFAFSRTLSPLLLVGVLAIAAISAPFTSVRRIMTDRIAIGALVATGLIAAVAGVMVLLSGTLTTVPGTPIGHDRNVFLVLMGQSDLYLRQMIGVFGWLDAPSPTLIPRIWLGTVLGLVLLAIVLVPIRRSGGALLAVMATVALPVAAQYPSVFRQGLPWQGRYSLPIAVGVPILAVMAIGESGRLGHHETRRVGVVVATVTGAAGLIAFFWSLRRYTTGIVGSFRIFEGTWQPPGSAVVLFAAMSAFVVASIAVMVIPRPSSSERRGLGRSDATQEEQCGR